MVTPINNEQPARQQMNLLPLTPRGQNVQVQSSVPTKLAMSYIVTISPSANENASSDTKQNFFKKAFSVVVTYVANPVAVGAKFVAKTAKSGFKALAGLFEKTNETTAKINEELAEGETKDAANIAAKYLEDAHVKVDGLTDLETLKLYDEYCSILLSAPSFVKKGMTRENILDIMAGALKRLHTLKLSDNQKAKADRIAIKSVEDVIKTASADEISHCVASLTNVHNEIVSLANTIKDKTLRADVMAQINDSNAQLADVIVKKLSEEPNNNEFVNTFVENVKLAKNVYHISCDLTEKVVEMLLENRAEQNRLDTVSADKLAQKVQIEKKEDEKTYMKKIDDNRRELKSLQEKLGKLLYATPEDEEKINSQIIAEINKPKPLPSA